MRRVCVVCALVTSCYLRYANTQLIPAVLASTDRRSALSDGELWSVQQGGRVGVDEGGGRAR